MSGNASWQGPRPFFGSHVLGSSSIRIHDAELIGDELYDKSLPDTIKPTNWTENTMKSHIQSLLNKLPRKLDSLILVNTGLFNYKIAQAAALAVTNGTVVKIIPSLMARFLYITNNIQTPIKENQHVLILTKVTNLTDFHVLQRKNSIYNFVFEFQGYPINVVSLFKKYASKYIEDGGIAVILYDEANRTLNDEIVKQCPNINIIQTICPNWDEMLLHGGINKAATVMSQDTKNAYDVKDFTIGFQLITNQNTSSDGDKTTLIKVGASIPIKCYEEKEFNKRVKILSNPTTAYTKTIYKRYLNSHYFAIHNKEFYTIQIEIDENGIETILLNKKGTPESNTANALTNGMQERLTSKESKPGSSKSFIHNDTRTFSKLSYPQPVHSYSHEKYQSSSDQQYQLDALKLQPHQINLSPEVAEQQSLILPVPADYMICLNERHCCICLPSGKNSTTRITNINGNKWIPMYVSFLNSPPKVGETALLDMSINPEFVIYDILNLIFVPYSEIQIKPEWAFNIAYTEPEEKHTLIEVRTWKGPHAVDPVSVLALVLIGLHKEAERVSGKQLRNVFVKTTKYMGRMDENAIRNAVKISRLECAGIEAMPVLKVE